MISKNEQIKFLEKKGIQIGHESLVTMVDLNKEFNYRYLDMPYIEEIGQEIWESIPTEIKKTQYTSNPAHKFKRSAKLIRSLQTIHSWNDIYVVGLIIVDPKSFLPIHVDTNYKHMYSLNIPIYNTCNKSMTYFFKPKNNSVTLKVLHACPKYNSKDSFYVSFLEDVEFLDCFPLVKPAIFNTHIPHAVVNDTDDFRCILSFRFNSPINFKKINDKFISVDLNINKKLIQDNIIETLSSYMQ